MAMKDKISQRGKKILLSPTVMRVMSDDRVMRAAEGLMDAPSRMRAAWRVLVSGHDLPNIDPALDESLGEVDAGTRSTPKKTNGQSNGSSAAVSGSSDMKESLKERSSLSGDRWQGRIREVRQVFGCRQRPQDGDLPVLPAARSERRSRSGD